MIDIVCSIDENYIEYCGVMLTSLVVHTPHEKFRIHIICSSMVENKGKEKLKAFCDKYQAEVYFYDVDYSLIKDFPIRKQDHLSLAAYLRLFMSELIPSHINKVLYLDCDLIAVESIKELWEKNIDDIAVAAVEERSPFDTQSPVTLKYPTEYSYFNSGVMLINLQKWREKKFVDECKHYISLNYDNIKLHDQDVLNALLYKEKEFISIRWNLMDFFLYAKPEVQSNRKEDWQKALKSPAIIHFTGKRKPWMYNCDSPYRDLYIQFAKLHGWHVINHKNAIHYCLRKILYKIIKKKKTINLVNNKGLF